MSEWSLEASVAIVTGAGKGLGAGAALELARAGATVVCVSRTRSDLDAVSERIRDGGGRAAVFVADVTVEAQATEIVRFAEELGDLRVLVTAAGMNQPGPAADYPTSAWDRLFDINVRATFIACREVGSSLLRRKVPGSIVTVSSQMGSVGYPARAAYCATKHAVEGLTKALAVERARAGIRVNSVAPTFVETSFTAEYFADAAFRKEVLEQRLPTGRAASVEEVAGAIRYLATPGAKSVTGHTLKIDGGWTAW